MARVFFSYSHKDEALRDQLEAHLAVLKSQRLVEAWHDRRILGGDGFDEVIFANLERSNIILLLVSSDFLNSDYCYSREMTRALELHEAGKARVIPVILRHCLWQSTPFGKLQAAPRDAKPITSWPDKDEAMADVARMIAKAIQHAPGMTTLARQASTGSNVAAVAEPSRSSTPSPGPVASSGVRSSNLRLKREFSQQDRDVFLRSTFEFIWQFFEGSVGAIRERNPGVEGTFERIDSRRIAAVLYRSGKKIAECSVRIDGLGGRANGLAFSHDAGARDGTFNEMLSVHASEHDLYMKPMGMAWGSGNREAHLSQEGAAEYLWDMFIRAAQ